MGVPGGSTSFESMFARHLAPGEVLIETAIGTVESMDRHFVSAASAIFPQAWLLRLLGLYFDFGEYYLVGVTDRRLVLLRVDSSPERTVADCRSLPLGEVASRGVRITDSGGRVVLDARGMGVAEGLRFEPLLLDANCQRARAIGERIGSFEAAPRQAGSDAAGIYSLSIVPFAGWRARRRALQIGAPVLLVMFVAVLIGVDSSHVLIGRGLGAPCDNDRDCRGHWCLEAIRGPGVCTAKCESDGDCGEGSRCPPESRSCVPAGELGYGAPCSADWVCKSGECARSKRQLYFCSQPCEASGDCPAESICSGGRCFLPAAVEEAR